MLLSSVLMLGIGSVILTGCNTMSIAFLDHAAKLVVYNAKSKTYKVPFSKTTIEDGVHYPQLYVNICYNYINPSLVNVRDQFSSLGSHPSGIILMVMGGVILIFFTGCCVSCPNRQVRDGPPVQGSPVAQPDILRIHMAEIDVTSQNGGISLGKCTDGNTVIIINP
jgi:hypothetical protein